MTHTKTKKVAAMAILIYTGWQFGDLAADIGTLHEAYTPGWWFLPGAVLLLIWGWAFFDSIKTLLK